jgi:hypothetical protein
MLPLLKCIILYSKANVELLKLEGLFLKRNAIEDIIMYYHYGLKATRFCRPLLACSTGGPAGTYRFLC